jgi:hypothetical protein
MLFSRALKEKTPWKFVLQDYNDIFGLVTVPNLFLTWYILEYGPSDNEIDVTSELKQHFLSSLNDIGIEIQLVQGAWSPELTVPYPSLLLY